MDNLVYLLQSNPVMVMGSVCIGMVFAMAIQVVRIAMK
jgi:hypothetical protein